MGSQNEKFEYYETEHIKDIIHKIYNKYNKELFEETKVE